MIKLLVKVRHLLSELRKIRQENEENSLDWELICREEKENDLRQELDWELLTVFDSNPSAFDQIVDWEFVLVEELGRSSYRPLQLIAREEEERRRKLTRTSPPSAKSMTVQELIKQLETFSPDTIVLRGESSGSYGPLRMIITPITISLNDTAVDAIILDWEK